MSQGKEKAKLLNGLNRMRGQIEAMTRAVNADGDDRPRKIKTVSTKTRAIH